MMGKTKVDNVEISEQFVTESEVTKCNCGADMRFEPVSGKLKCDYCDSTRDIVKRPSFLRDYDSHKKEGVITADSNKYKCPNCGADIELAAFETATKCPYCGSTNIIKFDDLKGMKPDSILPFLYTKENAAAAGKKWIKKKILAPSSLKKSFNVENFNGLYIPSFGFDANTTSQYDGRFGENRTRVVGAGKDRHTETYIEWYTVKGVWNKDFHNMMVEASTQISQQELNRVLPYDMENAEAYNRDYLAGFAAERYDTSIDHSYSIAKGQMEQIIRDEIKSKYHADHIDYLHVYMSDFNRKFRYTLLPLWICSYKFKQKLYRFIVNGRTGAATGKTPKSPVKIAIIALTCLALIALIALAVLHFEVGLF